MCKVNSTLSSDIAGFNIVRRMASIAVPDVEIDPSGTFKYILIQLTTKDSAGTSATREIVRGYAECPYHSDIDDKVTEQLQKLKLAGTLQSWTTKVLGGGRIAHDAALKTIKVYGYSQGFGKADHQIAVALIKRVYPNYEVTWSDDGY